MSIAICRDLPATFLDSLKQEEPTEPIDLEKAKRQKNEYVNILRRLASHVIVLPADDRYPDCVFIEDTAIVINREAVITHPGAPSRRGEVEAVEKALREICKSVRRMRDEAPSAFCDGGDVMFTGREIFVGQSKRSNQEAVQFLQKCFPQYSVVGIEVEGTLHLKSVTTCVADALLFPETPAGERVKRQIDPSKRRYRVLTVPDPLAANCLWFENTIVMPAANCPASKSVVSSLGRPIIECDMSELNKVSPNLDLLSLHASLPIVPRPTEH